MFLRHYECLVLDSVMKYEEGGARMGGEFISTNGIVPRRGQTRLPQFLPGDIILFAGRGDLYSRFSRWLMRTPGENETYAVHTAQFLDGYRVLEMDIVGRIKSINDVLNNKVDLNTWERRGFEVWRCTRLTLQQRLAVTHEAMGYVHVRFGMAKFFMYLFDGLATKLSHREIRLFRRLGRGERYPVCSGITAFVYDKAVHYRFGITPECADPDHIHDWVLTHPDEWEQVFRLGDYQQKAKAKII
jgi:hypothetical protein